jgi:hypothetical protein
VTETKTVTNSSVSLSFRYVESDYVRALRADYADRLRLWLDICVIVVVGAAGIYLWPSLSGKVFLGVSVAFAAMLLAAFFVIPPLIFRRQPQFRDDYSLTFSPEGIHFQTVHINSKLTWGLYSRAMVDAHSYMLYYGSRTFTVIPKRVFQNNQQQDAFDELLAEHIPTIVRKK